MTQNARMIEFPRPDGSRCAGYYAEAGKDKPSVVVIQEWWGLNPQIRSVAERFAAAGYNALAPDLYHGRVTQDADEANHLMNGLDFPGATFQDIKGAIAWLASAGNGQVVALTSFARTPKAPSSWASDPVKPSIACLLAV